MFGYATYMTPVSSKADIYTEDLKKRLPRTAQLQMIIARAALGVPFRAQSAMQNATRPPDGPDGRPLDSVIAMGGSCVDHTEIMLYSQSQALPLCVVSYSHDASCVCA